jgi:26S proteasome regulatory subunit N2
LLLVSPVRSRSNHATRNIDDKQKKVPEEKLATIVTEKHQSTLIKIGAILSTGILDAGGRNCSLGLGSRTGFTKMSSAVGLALWLHHWHWYPMMHMFSLALTPTYTVGLNKDFKFSKNFEIQSNSKPGVFAYPKKLEEKKEEGRKEEARRDCGSFDDGQGEGSFGTEMGKERG